MHILYLEDFEPDIQLIQQYMDSVNHDFTSVGTVPQAREYLLNHQPDIFLVDIMIGRETAYGLIEEVVKQKQSKHVVAVTAKVLPTERKKCIDLGCDRVIAKPFTIDELEYTLDQLA